MGVRLIILFAIILAFEAAYIRVARRFHIGVPASEPGTSPRFTPVGIGWAVMISAVAAMVAAPSLAATVACGAVLALMSFADDMRGLPATLRLTVHSVVVLFLFAPMIGQIGWAAYLLLSVCAVGYMNSSNFMDGINGMLTGCGAATLASLAVALPAASDMRVLCIYLLVGVAAMAVFNFRARALAFAGDVGSITLGFFIAAALAWFITTTGNVSAVVMVAVFVTDTFITFIHRVVSRERLMTSHRTHLYQLLQSRMGYSNVTVSAAYAVMQLLVSAGWFVTPADYQNLYAAGISLTLVLIYGMLRHRCRTLPELTR